MNSFAYIILLGYHSRGGAVKIQGGGGGNANAPPPKRNPGSS